MKFLLRLFLRLCFGFRAFKTEALQTPGPVLLVPNHVSWLDWLFLGVVLEGVQQRLGSKGESTRGGVGHAGR